MVGKEVNNFESASDSKSFQRKLTIHNWLKNSKLIPNVFCKLLPFKAEIESYEAYMQLSNNQKSEFGYKVEYLNQALNDMKQNKGYHVFVKDQITPNNSKLNELLQIKRAFSSKVKNLQEEKLKFKKLLKKVEHDVSSRAHKDLEIDVGEVLSLTDSISSFSARPS